ncbi:MAG: hypothetical protein AB1489_25060 [Acidobacteriota bacterium]
MKDESIISVTAVAGVFRTMNITCITDITTLISVKDATRIMDVRQYSNGELITKLLDSQQPFEQTQLVWQEFIRRNEHLVVKAIRYIFHLHSPRLEPTTEHICEINEQVFLQLAKDNYQPLNKFRNQSTSLFENYLEQLVFQESGKFLNRMGRLLHNKKFTE